MDKLSELMISGENIYYVYRRADEEGAESGEITALAGLDISVRRGEFVTILGRNGSGKSTLAKHFNALLVPSGGKVFVSGMDTGAEENVWDIRRRAGMVFQNPDNQIIATIIEEDVAFGAENLGLPSAETRKRVDAALKSVGMSAFARHSPHLLSGGQKQRVAIAGILAMKPECIILDEPTAMLDPSGRKDVIEAVSRLNREEGITIILITHFMNEAVAADRVFVMSEGRIVMSGPPREIFSRADEIRAVGLDVPQVTECSEALIALGYPLPRGILTVGELADEIMKLSQFAIKERGAALPCR